MTQQQFRWLLLACAGGLIAFMAVRRRQQLAAALPEPLMQQAERFVIPWSTLDRTSTNAEANDQADDTQADQTDVSDELNDEADQENSGSMQRKVSATNRISFGGKRYGPLPQTLVGQYVDVEVRNGQLFILHQGTPIATFDLQR